MTGIYKITNLKTGQCYIGQSIDIERRFAEHKTPKAGGNMRLHSDIKRFGVNNFKFEVIEECEPEMLLEREQYFIKMLLPYYNTIGKPMPDETKKKVSDGTKKWWENLSDEARQKVISNNLTGPRKGHLVSQETREKISRKVSEVQKQKVRCIETGEMFPSVGDFERSVGACTGTAASYWSGKIKSVKGYHIEKCRD